MATTKGRDFDHNRKYKIALSERLQSELTAASESYVNTSVQIDSALKLPPAIKNATLKRSSKYLDEELTLDVHARGSLQGDIPSASFSGTTQLPPNSSCVLVFDPATQAFTLDRIDAAFTFTDELASPQAASPAGPSSQQHVEHSHHSEEDIRQSLMEKEGEADSANPYDWRHHIKRRPSTPEPLEPFDPLNLDALSPSPEAKPVKAKPKPRPKPQARAQPPKPIPARPRRASTPPEISFPGADIRTEPQMEFTFDDDEDDIEAAAPKPQSDADGQDEDDDENDADDDGGLEIIGEDNAARSLRNIFSRDNKPRGTPISMHSLANSANNSPAGPRGLGGLSDDDDDGDEGDGEQNLRNQSNSATATGLGIDVEGGGGSDEDVDEMRLDSPMHVRRGETESIAQQRQVQGQVVAVEDEGADFEAELERALAHTETAYREESSEESEEE